MQAVTGSISAISGLVGAVGGLRGAKVGAGIGPLFSILSGQEQQAAAQEEARLLGKQADIAFSESLREAARVDREVNSFKEEQAVRFARNGSLEGSPLGVLTETAILGREQSNAVKNRGDALSGLLSAQGLQMLRRGSAASFGGFASALQQQFESQMQSKQVKEQAIRTGLSGFAAGLQGFAGRSSSTGRGASPASYGPAPGSPLATIHGPL